MKRSQAELTVVLDLLIVLDRLSWLFMSVNVLKVQASPVMISRDASCH